MQKNRFCLKCLALFWIVLLSFAAHAQNAPKSAFFTTSDGVRIHYLEVGKGPSIVLIPGWTMPAWIWEKQMAHFAAQYHVVAMDPRSQGDSDKPVEGNYPERRARDYKELVDQLKLAPTVLVGWSMGVPEILAYVDQFGVAELRGVVLVDGFVVFDEGVQKVFSQWLRLMAMDRKGFANRFIPSMYKKLQSVSYYQRLAADSLKTPTNTAAELLIMAHQDWSGVAPKLAQTPVLFTVTKPLIKQLDVVRAGVPNLQSEVFEDAGHALFVDEAERFNSLVEKFVESTKPKGP